MNRPSARLRRLLRLARLLAANRRRLRGAYRYVVTFVGAPDEGSLPPGAPMYATILLPAAPPTVVARRIYRHKPANIHRFYRD